MHLYAIFREDIFMHGSVPFILYVMHKMKITLKMKHICVNVNNGRTGRLIASTLPRKLSNGCESALLVEMTITITISNVY